MNELQRTQYLEEMGIDVFVPRFVLPAAKPSVQAALPEAPVIIETEAVAATITAPQALNSPPSHTESPVVVPERSSSSVSGIVTNIMGALGAELEAASPVKKEVTEGSVATDVVADSAAGDVISQQQNVTFTLNLWRVNSSLLVIDTHQPKQALPTATLLSNILFAKGIKQRLPSPEVLTWPMFNHGGSQGGWKEAGDMVNAFLNARLSTQPAQYIWLMGESAFKAVCQNPSQKQDYEEQIGSALSMSDISTLALVLPSLTDMLLKPELKRQTWNAIRAYNVE